jgi:predicted amidohydrolase YtcJ
MDHRRRIVVQPDRYAEHRLPSRGEIDAAAPNHPVMFLNGAHEAVVNSTGLRALGITRGMGELKGAHIVLDDQGDPTGVIQEGMAIFPDLRIPDADLRRYYGHVIPQTWNAQGYTSIYAIAPLHELKAVKELAAQAPATLRYTVAIFTDRAASSCRRHSTRCRFADVDPVWYRFAGIKVWIVATLMRGGAVMEPAPVLRVESDCEPHRDELDALALQCTAPGSRCFCTRLGIGRR